jgi:hypothetical protein
MELFSYSLSQFVHCWCIERLQCFVSQFLYSTLLKLFMVSKRFWVEFFGSLRYRIMSSANSAILTVSLPVCIPFISSCLIVLARNSRTMNRSGESGHPCLIPEFRGDIFSFSSLSMMLAVGLSHITFIMLKTFFLFLVFLELLS